MPFVHREAVKHEIQDMLKQGVIEPSSEEWSSPVVLVKKKDGSIHLAPATFQWLMDQVLQGKEESLQHI